MLSREDAARLVTGDKNKARALNRFERFRKFLLESDDGRWEQQRIAMAFLSELGDKKANVGDKPAILGDKR